MKQHLFLVLTTFLLFLFLGCESEELNIDSLQGSWIESTSQSDTLIFDSNEFEGWVSLNRGKELRGGNMLPKLGSGIYDYKISGDSIKLQNLLSSCLCPKSYVFEMLPGGNKLNIGNFFNDDTPLGELLIFEKF
jgi:hypothetical protein